MFKSNRNYKEMGMRIAVDFDGTITEDSPFPITGCIRDHCKEVLDEFVANGHEVILWTARKGKYLREAKKIIKVNRLPVSIPRLRIGKIEADIYIDDRNPWHKQVDWLEIKRSLL